MAMPDAIGALLALLEAPAERLRSAVYNVASFNPSADELAARTRAAFPRAEIAFAPDPRRQSIVDSWPADLEVGRAQRDWGFKPEYDLERTFEGYLLPAIRRRYAGA